MKCIEAKLQKGYSSGYRVSYTPDYQHAASCLGIENPLKGGIAAARWGRGKGREEGEGDDGEERGGVGGGGGGK